MGNQVNEGLGRQDLSYELTEERPVPPLSFLRRIYFLRTEPSPAIYFFHMQGQVTPPTVEEDWAREPMLQEYLDRKDEVDVLEWTAPDPAVEEVCMRAAWLGVEKDGDTYKVIDASDTLPQGEVSAEEINELLDILEARIAGMSQEQRDRMFKIQAEVGSPLSKAQ